MSTARRRASRLLARPLPPLVAPRAAMALYPPAVAVADDEEALGRVVTGSRYRCRTSQVFGGLGMLQLGYYEWRSVAVAAATCRPGDAVVEVGSHIGTETLCFADLVGPTGRVDAFEPLDDNADLLQANLDLNGADHVQVHRAAVDDAPGTLAFARPASSANTAAGHLLTDDRTPDGVRAVTVPVVTLDDTVGRDRPVRLLSVDAEGADTGVLKGGRELIERDRPVLIVEALPPHSNRYGRWTLDDLAAEVRGHRYAIWRIGRTGLDPIDPEATGDDALRPTAKARAHLNWLCLPQESADEARRIDHHLRRAAVLPCLPGLNPLRRRR